MVLDRLLLTECYEGLSMVDSARSEPRQPVKLTIGLCLSNRPFELNIDPEATIFCIEGHRLDRKSPAVEEQPRKCFPSV